MNRLQRLHYGNPLFIAVIYLVVSAIWIRYSDQFVLLYFDDPEIITSVQTYKGWFFVAVSALFVYLLIQLNNNELSKVIEHLNISRKEFLATFEQAAVGMVHHLPNEKFIRVNQKLCDILGYDKEELLNMKFEDLIPPADLKRGRELDQELMDGKRSTYVFEKDYIKKNGEYITIKITKSIVHNGKISPVFLIGIIEDITGQKQAEQALSESEEKYRLLFETMQTGVVYMSGDGMITYANPAAEKILGLKLDQISGKSIRDPRWKMIYEDGATVPESDYPIITALKTGKKVGPVTRGIYIPEKNEYAWLFITAFPLFRTGEDKPFQIYAMFDDITKRRNAEEEINKNLEEKEILLSEIHHRVKNNLAIISSMIQLQALEEKDQILKKKLAECTLRIKAIAEIHEELYHSESLLNVDFRHILKNVINGIAESIAADSRIDIEYNCQSVQLNVNQAIPCSLIVNEVVSKSVMIPNDQPESRKMTVYLSEEKDRIRLRICDDGVNGTNLPELLDSNSLHENLLDGLSQQLNGAYKFSSHDSLIEFSLEFKKAKVKGIGSHYL